MNRLVLVSVLCAGIALASVASADVAPPLPPVVPVAAFHFDRAHTNITFSLNHFGFSTAYGIFKTFDLSVSFDPSVPEKTKLGVKIDAASIDTGWPARDEELRSKSFFNAAQYPLITFKSTRVERIGEKTAKLTGDLTMLGITKPLVLNVTLVNRGPHPFRSTVEVDGFAASGVLKRSDYGMTTLLPGLGDEVTLTISAEINNSPPKPVKP